MGTEQAAMNWKSQKLDEIGKNSVWREHLKKEREGRVLNTTFRLNPRTMVALTDKPTSVNPNLPPPRKKPPGEIDETQRALEEALQTWQHRQNLSIKRPRRQHKIMGGYLSRWYPEVHSFITASKIVRWLHTRQHMSNHLESRHSVPKE